MLRSPRATTALAIAMLALLTWSAPGAARIHPADAAAHEGQRVLVEGVVVDVRAWPDGDVRTTIAQDGAGLVVQHDGEAPRRGAWLAAAGNLRRAGGELRLHADSVTWQAAPASATTPLALIALEPAAFVGRFVSVRGEADSTWLRDGDHAIRLGDGPWLTGAVRADGTIGYDAGCVCHRLHAGAVRPWS